MKVTKKFGGGHDISISRAPPFFINSIIRLNAI